jgi:DNA-binding transcriptional ArsR family regulator
MGRFKDKQATTRGDGGCRPPLADEAIESVASWLRVIAEPTRIRLIEILNGGGASVQGLASQLGTTRQNVSQHLGVMRRAGIVHRRRTGNWVLYELIDFSGWWMVEQALDALAGRD